MIVGTTISASPISGESPIAFINAGGALQLTSVVQNFNLPINCVVAGQQHDPKKKAMGLSGIVKAMRGIFGE